MKIKSAAPFSHWAMALGGLGLATLLLFLGRGSTRPAPQGDGGHISFSITVVPADAKELDCRGALDIPDGRCGYDAQGNAVGAPVPLRPYLTVARQLLLLKGVFEVPAVAAWLAQANTSGSAARATLECTGTVLGVAPSVEVRFGSHAPWGMERGVTAVRVASCIVVP